MLFKERPLPLQNMCPQLRDIIDMTADCSLHDAFPDDVILYTDIVLRFIPVLLSLLMCRSSYQLTCTAEDNEGAP
uniref:Calponin-homology (CH) domain-containing protein n=1 Tax=Steinernema glaseri TaxID=37863 RepID=A0A1I7YYM0_9BILA